MTKRCLYFTWIPAVFLLALPAQAARYDLNLGRFFNDGCDRACAQGHFQDLMTELGLLTAPVFLAPAETLGLNGFEFALAGSIAPIHSSEEYWVWAAEGSPQSAMFIPRITVRKGLPFSFEVGTNLAYVPNSELFVVGAEAKWAMNEGFYYIPDLAFRVSFNHLIGAKDFELTEGGFDVSISKAFGIGGMLSLTPYAGYNMLFIHGSSHVVLADDATLSNQVFSEVNWQDNAHHRFFVGCRLKTYLFQLTAEGIFTSGMQLFSFKIGFDY